jgi:hypothetical protein
VLLARYAAPFCSLFNCKQHSRTQQRHCTQQRAEKQAAPPAANHLARNSSTSRGSALNHMQPRAQRNSSSTEQQHRTRQRAEAQAALRAAKLLAHSSSSAGASPREAPWCAAGTRPNSSRCRRQDWARRRRRRCARPPAAYKTPPLAELARGAEHA